MRRLSEGRLKQPLQAIAKNFNNTSKRGPVHKIESDRTCFLLGCVSRGLKVCICRSACSCGMPTSLAPTWAAGRTYVHQIVGMTADQLPYTVVSPSFLFFFITSYFVHQSNGLPTHALPWPSCMTMQHILQGGFLAATPLAFPQTSSPPPQGEREEAMLGRQKVSLLLLLLPPPSPLTTWWAV